MLVLIDSTIQLLNCEDTSPHLFESLLRLCHVKDNYDVLDLSPYESKPVRTCFI